MTRPNDASVRLFDEIILAKKNRARTSLFSKSSTSRLPKQATSMHFLPLPNTSPYQSLPSTIAKKPLIIDTAFLSDTSDHLWRSAAAPQPTSSSRPAPGHQVPIMGRTPAQLDPTLMKEPRIMQGVPRANQNKARRKPVPSMLGLEGLLPGEE